MDDSARQTREHTLFHVVKVDWFVRFPNGGTVFTAEKSGDEKSGDKESDE